jgi:hypothetical protein
MTDADVCAQMSVGEPTISLAALAELRAFLDSTLRSQEHTTEHADAQAGPESGSPRRPRAVRQNLVGRLLNESENET